MKEYYTINEVATMSGLTTRTIRNYIKLGMLEGEKVDGIWQFSADALNSFMQDKSVQSSMQAKKNGIVFDFLADRYKKCNEICTILDFPVSQEEATEIGKFFCDAVNGSQGVTAIHFNFEYVNGIARIILKGPEDFVTDVMKRYYE